MQVNPTLLFIPLLLFVAPLKLTAQVTISDSMALVDLYDSTNGNTWSGEDFRNTWKSSSPVSNWAGVTVTNNRVTGLQMYGNHLTGTVPASFKNLDGITSIDFIDNGFRGDLLEYIANFKELKNLHIGEQFLKGPFPEALGYLPKLTNFYVYGPGLDGPLPLSFGNLNSLVSLDISYSAHSGFIPAIELSNLIPGLQYFSLENNRYTFKELEPLVVAFTAKNMEGVLAYSSQENIATLQKDDDLTVSAGGVLQHNTYQWFKTGTGLVATISGDSVYKPTSPGTYYASVTNSVANQLTLNSNPLKAAAVGFSACPLSTSVSIGSDVSGAAYQWQESLDSVNFNNLSNNTNFSGTNAGSLQLQDLPSEWYGRKYRCIVDGIPGTVFTLHFSNNWLNNANTNWDDTTNWSCGKLPDINTDVVISSGNVIVNSNVTVRSLHLANGVNFTVSPGYKLTVTQGL